MSQSCMVCGRTTLPLFKIKKRNGSVKRTVENAMIVVFGSKVTWYIGDGEVICNVCTNLLDRFSKLKKQLWGSITKSNKRRPIIFDKIWTIFASLTFEVDHSEEEETSQNHGEVPQNGETLCHLLTPSTTENPSNESFTLWTLNRSEPYNANKETEWARKEYYRSKSTSRFFRSDSSDCSEHSIRYRKRRKKRGHGWAKPKNTRSCYGALSDYASSGRGSPASSYSGYSRSRFSPSRSSEDESEFEEDDDKHGDQKRNLPKEKQIFICEEKGCTLDFMQLGVLNFHVINDHKIRALFICDDCGVRYAMKKHLDYHWRTAHDTKPFFCLICQDELPNVTTLQEHLDEHMAHSYPCCFCDRSFISSRLKKKHIKIFHQNQREREIVRNKFFMINYKNEPCEETQNSGEPKKYQVFISLHTDMNNQPGDLDVTKMNLDTHNIELFSGEGMVASGEAMDWIKEKPLSLENNLSNSENSNNVGSDFGGIVSNYVDIEAECANNAITCDNIASDYYISDSDNFGSESLLGLDEIGFNGINNFEIDSRALIDDSLHSVGINEGNNSVSDHETETPVR